MVHDYFDHDHRKAITSSTGRIRFSINSDGMATVELEVVVKIPAVNEKGVKTYNENISWREAYRDEIVEFIRIGAFVPEGYME